MNMQQIKSGEKPLLIRRNQQQASCGSKNCDVLQSSLKQHYRSSWRKERSRREALAFFFCGAIFFFLLVLWIYLQHAIEGLHSTGNVRADSSVLSGSPHKLITNAKSLSDARLHNVARITDRAIDTSQYTIRMNTWRRTEHLLISLNHHASCEGVAVIQVVWCDAENDPPDAVSNHISGKVKVERHTINSLNERFRILDETPTLGVLSLDDDVLRPCEALDAAFIRWTRHPTRIVGFDARSHHIDRKMADPRDKAEFDAAPWEYGMIGESNSYSMTLPSKAAFVHRDYLILYTAALPRAIYRHIDEHFECEDIAMSYFVSALTGGRPPLLADSWATSSLELYSRDGISWKVGHLDSRNKCVNDFAEYLGLKEGKQSPLEQGESAKLIQPLQSAKLLQGSSFAYGDEPEKWKSVEAVSLSTPRLQRLVGELQRRETLSGAESLKNSEWIEGLMAKMAHEARDAGLIKGTIEWKLRWLFNCATELNSDKRTQGCFAKAVSADSRSFFVCDVTEGVMHYVGGSTDWMVAGPPKGTGTHVYAAFFGVPPCRNLGRCQGCLSPKVDSVCSVRIDPEDCSIELGRENVNAYSAALD
ncbi:hypothetical protein ACHAWF_012881 [Thalassiosira exigua]